MEKILRFNDDDDCFFILCSQYLSRQRNEKNLPIKRVETPKPRSATPKPPKSILKTSGRKDSKQRQLIFASPDKGERMPRRSADKVKLMFAFPS